MSSPHPGLLRLARSEAVGNVADENALLRSAHEHRMVSALLAGVSRGQLSLSRATLTTAGVWELAEQRRHLELWGTIREVQQRLSPAGTEVCVLKGVATEFRWYDRLGERVSTDVDLLLAPSALADVVEVVRTLQPDCPVLAAIGVLTRRRQLQHIDLVIDGVAVDLHLDPLKVGVATRQLDSVWAATELQDTPHGVVRVLRPEHELVLLLLHLNKDRFAYLGPFLDIQRLLERARIDWAYLADFVRGEGLTVPVYSSLAAVASTLGLRLDIPRPFDLRAVTWHAIWGASRRLGGDEARVKAPRVQRALVLHVRGRPGGVVRELRRQVFPPRELLEVAGRLELGEPYLRARRRGLHGAGRASAAAPREGELA